MMYKWSVILLFMFISVCFSQPPDKYLPHGFKSYIVNYNAIKGDPFLIDFSARQFVMVDEQGNNEGKSIIKINPQIPVLKYRCLVSSYQSFTNYYKILDPDERCFMHSFDPAGIRISKSGSTLVISWIFDRRYPSAEGYRIYVSGDDTGKGTSITGNIIKNNYFISSDQNLDGKYITIYTVKSTDSSEVLYSLPLKINFSNLPASNHIIKNLYTAKYNSTRDTVQLNIKTDSTIKVDSVLLQIDLNHNKKVTDAGETIPLSYTSPYWKILYSFDRGEYKAGTCFRILIKHNKVYDTLPSKNYYYTTNVNNRLRSDPYGNELMNPANSIWQDYTINEISAAFNTGNYSGVFTDNTTLGVQTWMFETPSPLYSYSEEIWNNGMISFLNKIRNISKGYPVFFNGNVQGTNSGLLLNPSDGGMYEGWCYSHWAGYASESSWISAQNQALITRNTFHKIFLPLGGTKMDDPDARLFVLASFLLTFDDSVWYANADSYQTFAHLPEMNLNLGKPLKTNIGSISELKEINLYIRRFEKGIVIVNPTASQANLPLSIPQNLVKVTAGTTVDGSRLYTEKYYSTVIPPRKGFILLYDSLASPLVKSVSFSPPNLSDAMKNIISAKVKGKGPLYVEAWLEGLLSHLKMNDDGVDGDIIKGDSVYSASFNLMPGTSGKKIKIRISAYDTSGLVSILTDSVKSNPNDSINLVTNYSFEYDSDNNGIPDNWNPYQNGFIYDTSGINIKSGKRSVHVISADSTLMYGVYTKVILNQTKPHEMILSGWSKANNVTGVANNDYSLYVDAYYTDGTPLYGQCAQFSTGTHDWQYSEKRIYPMKPLSYLNLYCLFRKHRGEIWYDHISVKDATMVKVKENITTEMKDMGIYPNPFNSSVRIRYSIRQSGKVNLKIYNILGQEVKTLVDEKQDNNTFEIIWDGTDKYGYKVTSGVYFCRIMIDGKVLNMVKMLMMK
jgi:hypothetical protein